MKRPQSEYLTEEIEGLTDVYAEFVISTIEELKAQELSVLALVEEKLDYSHIAPSGFGTGDMVILAPGLLHVCDFKTGSGVFVDADHNTQMMLYALGALHAYDYLFDIQTVSMTIIQPRLENISTFTCTKQELLDWARASGRWQRWHLREKASRNRGTGAGSVGQRPCAVRGQRKPWHWRERNFLTWIMGRWRMKWN